jgi:ComF family protein
MGEGILSAEAIASPPPFEQLRAVLLYDETARRLVSLLKYSDRTDLAPWMARWMAVAGKELIAKSDLIVPVPLHRHRLLQRRYNQAAELARHVARAGEVAFVPQAMIRTKKTKQQVGLTQSERERNLSGAFQVPDAFRMDVKSRRILLIDDVYTTGATARAAVRSLKRAGAKEVRVLVFAKVETHLL